MSEDFANQAGAGRDVFVSYASQDVVIANAVVEALERQGTICWIAPRDITPGLQYADEIVGAISNAKILVLVLSQHAIDSPHVGKEIERASSKRRRIIALRIDAAPLIRSFEYFLSESQWIDVAALGMPGALTKLTQAVGQGLAPSSWVSPGLGADATNSVDRKRKPSYLVIQRVIAAAVLLVVAAVVVGVLARYWPSQQEKAQAPAVAATSDKSIAVLPFVNMSGDKDQDYFSEGLTEELLNSLSRINQLQVAARTSSFSFQGEHPDIATVAHKLHVGAVLEGSVRRSGKTVRVTAQLINGNTGFHLWSETYDRDLGDVLKLQTEIATAVASALRVTLLGDAASRIELGGTSNPAALDAYLRGSSAYLARHNVQDVKIATSAFTEAIRLDPGYARAYAARAAALNVYGSESKAREAVPDAVKAISLAPDLGEAHLALADAYAQGLDFSLASEEYKRAFALAPGNAQVLQSYGDFAVAMGDFDAGLAAARRAVLLDPLNRSSHYALSSALRHARRYKEAIESAKNALALDPELIIDPVPGYLWADYYQLGDLQGARESCNVKRDNWLAHVCLAVIYDKLGRHADAEAELDKVRSDDALAYQWAEVYAQWGNSAKALDALDLALRLHDPGLQYLKVDSLFDPVRHESRFQAIERELKFPN
jgi:TolB-like protein/predicted Zn-dependent protease